MLGEFLMPLDLTQVLVALVVGIPATIAAWNSRQNKRQTATNNGTKLGALVEQHDERLKRIEAKLKEGK